MNSEGRTDYQDNRSRINKENQMAQLTWRNVDIPNFGGLGESQIAAQRLLASGLGSIGDVIQGMRERSMQRNDSVALASLSRFGATPDLQAALANGTALGGADPSRISPEVWRTVLGQTGELLQNDQARANLSGTLETNNQNAWANDVKQGYEAKRPLATQLALQANLEYAKGTPEGRTAGDEIMRRAAPTFAAAGWQADDALNIAASNTKAVDAGNSLNNALLATQDVQDARARDKLADNVLAAVEQTGITSLPEFTEYLGTRNDIDLKAREHILERAQKSSIFNVQAPDPVEFNMKQEIASRKGGIPLNQFAASDLPQEAYGLLGAIAGGEAPDYNTLNGGEKFSSYSWHPGRRGKGGASTAAGRYQYVAGTWDRVAKINGFKDFSPENQDRGAWYLAQDDYYKNTGRNLSQDLKAGNYEAVRQGLGTTWKALQDMGPQKFADQMKKLSGIAPQPIKGYGGTVTPFSSNMVSTGQGGGNNQIIQNIINQANNPLLGQQFGPQTNNALLAKDNELNAQIDNIGATLTADSALDPNDAITNAIVKNEETASTVEQVVDQLSKTRGKEGDETTWFESLDDASLRNAIKYVGDKWGASPDVAAAVMGNVISSRGSILTKGLGLSSAKVNYNELDNAMDEFFGTKGKEGESRIKGAVARLTQLREKRATRDELEGLKNRLGLGQKEYYTKLQAQAQRPTARVPLAQAQELYTATQQMIQDRINYLKRKPSSRVNSN
jgi:muramidase (phage lysozyme)